MPQPWRKLFGYLAGWLSGLILSGTVQAQTPVPGTFLREKLAKTQQEYQQAVATGDSLKIAEACYLMGKRHTALGDYGTAQRWFLRSLRILEPRGSSEVGGKVYLRMAENQVRDQQYRMALQSARRAQANFQTVRSQHGLMSAAIMLSGVYELGWRLNHEAPGSVPTAPVDAMDSTLYYLRRAERLAISLRKPYDIALVYACMGKALTLTKPAQAIPYLKKAYALNRNAGGTYDPYTVINLSQQLADCYLGVGKPMVAKKWLDAAVTIRDSIHLGEYWQNQVYEDTYTRIYEQIGDWKQAFRHQQRYYGLVVDALRADRDGAIHRAEMRYENEKKEARLVVQQQELAGRRQQEATQQRLTQVSILLLVIACIVGAILYWLFRKYQRLSRHNAQLVKEQNHRVKNNFQAITSLLGLQYNRMADSVARQVVEESLLRIEAMALVHKRLYDGDRLVEVELRQYVPELVSGVLRSFNFEHIEPVYTLGPIWLPADTAVSVGLLLNELVTNSCKYAFPGHPEPVLMIGFEQTDDRINCWFADNGPGFNPDSTRTTFGIKLIGMIVEKLNGKHRFSRENGCLFSLSFDSQPLTIIH